MKYSYSVKVDGKWYMPNEEVPEKVQPKKVEETTEPETVEETTEPEKKKKAAKK